MIVCICYNKSSTEIREAVLQGCNTVEKVSEWLNCCKDCQTCADSIQEIIDDTTGNQSH